MDGWDAGQYRHLNIGMILFQSVKSGKGEPNIAVLLCFVLCFVDTYTSGVLFGVPCKILFQCVHFTVLLVSEMV